MRMHREQVATLTAVVSSLTTLVCWALPIFFVTLGLGSVVASAVSMAPWLAILSRQKVLVFGLSAALLSLNFWLVVVRPRHCAPGEPCHVDSPMMRWNRRLFWLSTTIFVLAVMLTFGSELALQRS